MGAPPHAPFFFSLLSRVAASRLLRELETGCADVVPAACVFCFPALKKRSVFFFFFFFISLLLLSSPRLVVSVSMVSPTLAQAVLFTYHAPDCQGGWTVGGVAISISMPLGRSGIGGGQDYTFFHRLGLLFFCLSLRYRLFLPASALFFC